MSVRANWTFHNASVIAGNGLEYKIANVGANTTIAISITGTSTVYNIEFEAKGLIGDYESYQGFDAKNSTLSSTATQAKGKQWLFDLTGWDSFRARIVSLDANLSISGKVVE
jgi:hypothetical protein